MKFIQTAQTETSSFTPSNQHNPMNRQDTETDPDIQTDIQTSKTTARIYRTVSVFYSLTIGGFIAFHFLHQFIA